MSGGDSGRKPVVVWFRHDLRLDDHPAFVAAAATGSPVFCIYILDETVSPSLKAGGAYRWWLHGALASLRAELAAHGGTLLTLAGSADELLPRLVREVGAASVFAHHRVLDVERAQDQRLEGRLAEMGVGFQREWGTVLRDPQDVLTKDRQQYKVFTPFWKALQPMGVERPLDAPEEVHCADVSKLLLSSERLDEAALLPTKPDWAAGFRASWRVDAEAAHQALEVFLDDACADYADARNFLAQEGTSRLSPYLASGTISPRRIWHAVMDRGGESKGEQVFLSELAWREFAQYTLFHTPSLPYESISVKFQAMPWRKNERDLAAWQQGKTGVPIVDAAMRQLWHTGWMHNRARMIVGSFLTKHLLMHWQAGEAWFRDTLVDYDAASNAMNWQWVAGTGIDAAPFFRVFNPTLQAEKFDSNGEYIRTWVPELAKLSDKFLFEPWKAPALMLRAAGVELGSTYPQPIVDLAEGRERALAALKAL